MKISEFNFAALLCLFCLFIGLFPQTSFGQNENLYQEEELKDLEKEEMIRELEEAQKIEAVKVYEELSEEELEERNLVEVETNNILPSDIASVGALVPYKVRRKKWGNLFSLSYIMLNPTSYSSTYTLDFESTYGESIGMLEAALNLKYNFSLGSLATEIGFGTASAGAENGAGTDLSFTQARLGLKYAMDNVFYEPYIAPYAGVGLYVTNYKETLAVDSANGNTDPALYFLFGAYFQLDWMDRNSAVEAYTEGGIENTFLFIEARNYMSSEAAIDPDFSTEFSLAGGISLEF